MTVVTTPTRGPKQMLGVNLWEEQVRELDALAHEAGGLDRSALLRWAIDIAMPELRARLRRSTDSAVPAPADPS